MQGVILAAGKGKRLHPLTATRSKAMMPIVGKPIVERVMDLLVANGVDDFVLVISPDDREIVRHFSRGSAIEADVRFVYQVERKGMAHALMAAAPLINDDFVLSACDNLVSESSVAKVMDFWQTSPKPTGVLTLMAAELKRILSGATVGMDGSWVTRIIEKPEPDQILSDLASLPLYLFSPRFLDYLPDVPLSARGEYELQDAIQMLIARDGYVGGVIFDQRLTLTNADDLLALNLAYLANAKVPLQLDSSAIGLKTQLTTPLYVEQGVVIGKNCVIGPNVYIERDCHIGDGTTIRDAVILRGAVVGDETQIANQVIHSYISSFHVMESNLDFP